MLTWQIGDIKITQILEHQEASGKLPIIPDATPEALAGGDWMKPDYVTSEGHLILNIQMLVVETPDQKIVVDTCIGNDKKLDFDGWSDRQSPFLENLTELGHDPDSVDKVICTHLHLDHVGWNTRKVNGKWVPTFRNARYLMVDTEFEFWKKEGNFFGDVFDESVAPVADAGLVDLVPSDHQVQEGVWFEPTPGHTPGHISVHLASKSKEAIISGDMIHHPCQMANPDWGTPFDVDADAARATRKEFLNKYADSSVLIFGSHFAAPVAGKIVRDGEAFRFDTA